MSVLHVAPGHSAAKSLSDAIRTLGSNDKVTLVPDDWSVGPLQSDADRRAFRQAFYGEDLMNRIDAEEQAFVRALTEHQGPLRIWYSRIAFEHCSGLRVLDLIGDRAVEVAVANDIDKAINHGCPWVSLLNTSELATILQEVPPVQLSDQRRAAEQELWSRLTHENAPYRVWNGAGLVSAGKNVFDDLIFAAVDEKGLKMARVIGRLLADSHDNDGILATSDIVLMHRIQQLIDAGSLDYDGNPTLMHQCVIRRPTPA